MVYRLIIPRFAPIGINSTVHVHDPIVAIIIYVAYRFSNPLWGAAGVALTYNGLSDVTVASGDWWPRLTVAEYRADLVAVADAGGEQPLHRVLRRSLQELPRARAR